MSKNLSLFDESWKAEWVGMPEYVQDEKEPYSTLIVRFRNHEDLMEFAELVSQRLTCKTKSIWFPQLVRGLDLGKRYVDES